MEDAALPLDTYEATRAWLLGLEAARGMDFKLERVAVALRAVGDPQLAFRAIHVGGTNGKGSVAAMTESILRTAGMRTGLYTSPHLVDFRERIRVGARWISREDVVALVDRVRERVDVEELGLTFFEVTTVVALMYFAQQRVAVAVIEVGLGGRLDATNVVNADVAVITSIGFDHEAILGDSLEAIAAEKAGIFKPGRPAVVGDVAVAPMAVIEAAARRAGVPLARFGHEISIEGGTELAVEVGGRRIAGLRLGLRGAHQARNAALAVAAVERFAPGEIADADIRVGLESVRWPGRMETVCRSPLVVLDAAHNVDSAIVLARELSRLVEGRAVHLVFGVLGDKRWAEMIDVLAPHVARVTVTKVPVARGEAPEIVARRFAGYCPTDVVGDPKDAVGRAIARALHSDAVVVAGSVFLIGAVYSMFDPGAGASVPRADDGGQPTV